MPFVALPGFRDVYPDAHARRRRILEAWREVARRYGFEEYDGPPLEPLELYTQKSGEEITSQLYEFTDKGGRRVALRPEMTPTLARMVGARAQQLRKPIRWFSMPQLFRYERAQRGRLREHLQLNMDIVGEAGPGADAEIIAAALEVVRLLGFGPGQVRARVSDRRVLAAALRQRAGVSAGELAGVLSALDRFDRSREAAGEQLEAALGGDRARARTVMEFAEGLEGAGLLDDPSAGPLNQCLTRLSALGLRDFVDVDFRIVRGLAYYTGIVFELFDAGRSLRAICGGGRYDDLIGQLGGPELPCVGFGMGDVVLGELLEARDGPPGAGASAAVFVATVGEEDLAAALELAQALRARGYSVEYPLRQQPLRKQFELAAARGASKAVVIGPEERAGGRAVVRSLQDGVEVRVPFDDLRKDYAL